MTPVSHPMESRPNDTDAFWMPFTPMREFQRDPLIFTGAEGMHYIRADGRRVLDGAAGLWCVNAGHGHPRIVEAIRAAATRLDFVSSFKMTHPDALAYARRLRDFAPAGLDHVFFVNSGSEAVDSALKIARGYHHARGDAARTKLIGRAKGYHGMGFGGLSVSGIGRYKRGFGPLLADTAHLALPYDRETMGFSDGQPEQGAHLADELEALLQIEDPASVAAVIVEPVIGSGGVYPPPKGYLEKLRAICDRHGILLVFDEVVTGFGRLGAPFAAQAFGVRPDMLTCAKGMTNGAVPMGGVIVADHVYDAFMSGPPEMVELFHGYTYSAHPLACAAGLAVMDVFEESGLVEQAAATSPLWRARTLALKGKPFVADIRTIGLLGLIEIEARPGEPGARGAACARFCLEKGVLVRGSGDMLVLSPPLIIAPDQIDLIMATIEDALHTVR